MPFAKIELTGSDVRFSGQDLPEAREPLDKALPKLRAWAQRYDAAAARDSEGALLEIGREMIAWLDGAGFASNWLGGAGDRVLEIVVSGQGDAAAEAALLDAPRELLATDHGPLAADDLQLFVVARRVGGTRRRRSRNSATCG